MISKLCTAGVPTVPRFQRLNKMKASPLVKIFDLTETDDLLLFDFHDNDEEKVLFATYSAASHSYAIIAHHELLPVAKHSNALPVSLAFLSTNRCA